MALTWVIPEFRNQAGWHGQLARPVGPLAQRNAEEINQENSRPNEFGRAPRSERRVAARDSPERFRGCATQREDCRRLGVQAELSEFFCKISLRAVTI